MGSYGELMLKKARKYLVVWILVSIFARKKRKLMTAIELKTSVLNDISTFAEDESLMARLYAYVQKLKKERAKSQALKEWTAVAKQIKMAKEGKIEGRPLEELLNEL